MAAVGGAVVHQAAFGQRELGKDAAMTLDTVVWLASMTKPLTTAAVMQLVERGKLELDSPAAKVLPELAQVQVLEGFETTGKPRLRRPKQAITLRRLLTHTAGFSYEIWNADIAKYLEATGTPGIRSRETSALTTPLLFDPGRRWEYGMNLDWAGKMVEAVSGLTLGDYLQENLFAPLGMNSTSFRVSADRRTRLASKHARAPDGSLSVIPFDLPEEPQFHSGGGGLYGTAPDYIRFNRMVLNRGSLDGIQVLKPETIEMMSRNQIGGIDCVEMKSVAPSLSKDANFFPGMKQKWSFGFLINTARTSQGRSPGSLAWAGLANTFFWIDPAKGVTGVVLTQVLPFFDDKAVKLFRDYETAVYRSL